MILKKLLNPSHLVSAHSLCIHESMKLIIVSRDKKLAFTVLQVVAPSLEGFNNSKELLIVGFILSLNWYHSLKEKDFQMPLTNFGLGDF